jgi:protein-S-isoprenylcysteine O-methyltransferase Ste14
MATTEAARDAAAVRFPPPLIFLGFVLLGPLIDRWLALPPLTLPRWLGVVVALPGLALIAAALGSFRQSGEDPTPWTRSNQVIATGLYARTRNPMYLGMAIVAFGLGVALASMMALLLTIVAAMVVGRTVIAREERYLEAKFGDGYRAYTARVRRWL